MAYKFFSGNDVAAASVAVASDSILIIDANDSSTTKKESVADLITALAGDGLAASSGVLSVDLSELTAAAVNVAADSIMIIDADDSNASKKESVADLATAMAGTGLSASSGAFSVDASQSQITTLAGLTAAGAAGADLALTYDSITVTDNSSGEPVFTLKNTNDDATGPSMKFLVDTSDSAAANDVLGNILFSGEDADENSHDYAKIIGGIVDPTSGGEEGALSFWVAEYDGTSTMGLEMKGLASDGNITVDVKTHDGSAGGLMLGGTLVSSTAAELNLLDTASANTVVNSKAVIYGSGGELAGTLSTAAQTNVTSLGTLTALTVDDVAVDGKVITMTGSTSDTAVMTVAANGAFSLVTTDDAAAAANIQITADGTVDIDSAGVLTLDSGAAINLEPAAGSAILLDGTISIDAGVVTGATSITSTAFVGDITGDVTGTADLATSFTVSANNSTDETVYPVFVDGATGSQGAETDTGLSYNPSSGNLTIGGALVAASLDISGSVDVDGTLEADAYTVDGTALAEYIADTVGAMVSSNTESGITVAYEDGDNTLDFTIATLNQDTTGTADNFTCTANNSTNETVYPVFVDGATGSQGAETDTGLHYNPSTGVLFSNMNTSYAEARLGVVSKTANYTVDGGSNPDSVILCDTATGSSAFTVTLPTPTQGRKLIVKDFGGGASSYAITLGRSGSGVKIDGAASDFSLNINYAAVTLVSDGTDWYIV